MDYRLDEIDKRILYYLAKDARNTSAPLVAEEVDVSPGTIRNRIRKLEEHGVIDGYHADIDYASAENLLTNLFVCNAPVSDRERLAREALSIPGVVNVREVMTGRENLHITVIGRDADDINRVGQELTDLGVEIENEGLVQREHFHPYHPYGPDDDSGSHPAKEFISLTGDAEVVVVQITESAAVTGQTVGEADAEGVLGDDLLVVAIERGDTVLTPKGDTRFEEGDIVTVLFREGFSQETVEAFGGEIVQR